MLAWRGAMFFSMGAVIHGSLTGVSLVNGKPTSKLHDPRAGVIPGQNLLQATGGKPETSYPGSVRRISAQFT